MNPSSLPVADLSHLRANFLARARGDARNLTELCESARRLGRADGLKPLTAMSSLLHRLAGTAGSFGFDALGQQARQLGTLVGGLLNGNAADYEARLQSLAEGARDMARRLEADFDVALEPGHEPTQAPTPHPDSPLVCVLAQDRAFGQRLRQVLEGFGYRIRAFASMAELEPELGRLDPSAVIVKLDDDKAPLAGVRKIRALRPEPVPMIVVSAHAEFDDFLDAVRAGADGYFVEPVDLPRMEARLHFLLERRNRDGLRVMLVDDDADLLAACGRILEAANMAVTMVNDPSAALQALAQFRPEVIVMDIRMPQCTGPELAQIIRMNEEWLHVPIVYMSTQSDGADQLLATRNAGEAFIAKPIDARELIATVVANGRHARQTLDTVSRDTLTGMLKQSFIKEHLASELERSQRTHSSTCAVMIDLDNFKSVNDQYGHLAGDVVIRTLATALRQRLRVIDGIGRVGGEEFLAVLADCGTAAARTIVDGVRERFAQIDFAGPTGSFRATFSAGIAESAGGLHPVAELVAAADKALYRAKGEGRNRVVAADDPG